MATRRLVCNSIAPSLKCGLVARESCSMGSRSSRVWGDELGKFSRRQSRRTEGEQEVQRGQPEGGRSWCPSGLGGKFFLSGSDFWVMLWPFGFRAQEGERELRRRSEFGTKATPNSVARSPSSATRQLLAVRRSR